jgi:putative transposase
MYSYEDRNRAVRLYIKLGKRTGATLRQLGYPTKNALKSWHREYEQGGDLPLGFVRSRSKYSAEQKKVAVEHYLNHDRCLAETRKALGYPCSETLADWLDELHPETRIRVVCGIMSRSRTSEVLNLSTWAEFDSKALPAAERKIFTARRSALELYVANTAIEQIEKQTGVDRRQLYRLLSSCTRIHEDGRIFGYRALAPYARVANYQRIKRAKLHPVGGSRGTAGAFDKLLQLNPGLSAWIDQQIHNKRIAIDQLHGADGLRIRLRGLKHLHSGFLHECRLLGLTVADYPLNTEWLGIRSLAAVAKERGLQHFARGARLAGATHLKGMPAPKMAFVPAASHAFDVVEFDGHRLDIRLKVVVRDPLEFEQEFEIERIWLLVIIDVWSRAVLGYHVSLNREYSGYDVIRTIEAALEPHRARTFTLPGVGYGALGGFPSGKMPELGYATWQWFKLDNAKANLAEDVRYALAEFMGCFMDAGPAYTPDDRPYIERFFGSIGANLSSRMPGYTGSNARDVRRALADPKGNLRLYVSLSEIEELLEAALATYNASPHAGLNGRTPLEAVEYSVRGGGALLNWLPESKRRTLCLMHTPKRVTVRGYLAQGQRPHVNFYGVRYTNDVLASTASFLGQELHLYYNSQDLRCVRAFSADGGEIGVLKAQGAWGEIAHDLKLRQEIVRLRGSKRLASNLNQEYLAQFIEHKFAKAKRTRRGASELTQTLRTLAAAPVAAAGKTPKRSNTPEQTDAAADASKTPERVEPQHLSIGTGYAGSS